MRLFFISLLLFCLGCKTLDKKAVEMSMSSQTSVVDSTATMPDVLLLYAGNMNWNIVYAPSIVPANYSWSIQGTENMPPVWSDEPVQQINTDIFLHMNNRPNLFLRLVGTPIL